MIGRRILNTLLTIGVYLILAGILVAALEYLS